MTDQSRAEEILLPSMGEGIVEATLVKWLKKEGDSISKGDPLLEVSTDKVDTEIPSPHSGVLLKASAIEGATVEVNSIIGWIGPKGASIPSSALDRSSASAGIKGGTNTSVGAKKPTPQTAKTRPSTSQNSAGATHSMHDSAHPEGGSLLLRTSPLVRKMAKDLQLDIRRVPGSGLNGRITKYDLEAFAASPEAWGSDQKTVTHAPTMTRLQTTTTNGIEMLEGVPVKREKMTKMRRLIAEHMVESVRTSPHVTTTFEIDLSNVVSLREKTKSTFKDKHGINLTFTHFLIKAAVDAIKKHPIVNVSVDGDEILWKESINIGCAVALGSEGGGGLIVPVIKNAEKMALKDIALKLNDLAERARSKKLAPDEVIGGTFSVTNPGGWGSIFSSPIINQPQVAMLGVGAIVKRASVSADDKIVVKPTMLASLTFDHRVIDGEGGAMWLATYKNILENWSESPV